MNATRSDGTVRMKLTISREEHPALFEALFNIRNPRRRTGRVKDLVIKGLALEQAGGTLGHTGQQPLNGLVPGTADVGSMQVRQPTTSVASMLEWDASPS